MMDAPFPGALFAMDGMMCMLTTKGKHNEYIGRKSLPQMNVLVVCDWNMNLVHIDSNFTGRTQDNNMYMSSALHFAIDGDDSFLRRGGFIIADEGFACREHILRPYNKRADDLEKILFNFVIKSTRLLVENAIGGVETEVPLAEHRDAQDGAARVGEDDPGVRSAVPVVEDDEGEGDERGHEDVHGQGEVHPITVHRETRREPARRGEAIPV